MAQEYRVTENPAGIVNPTHNRPWPARLPPPPANHQMTLNITIVAPWGIWQCSDQPPPNHSVQRTRPTRGFRSITALPDR